MDKSINIFFAKTFWIKTELTPGVSKGAPKVRAHKHSYNISQPLTA